MLAIDALEGKPGSAVLATVLGLNSNRGGRTCSMRRLAAIALSVSFTASVTAPSDASGSAIRLVQRAVTLPGASRVARPMTRRHLLGAQVIHDANE